MSKKSNLEFHGNSWRVVVRVPPSLRASVGKAHLKESLHTSDLNEANRKKHLVISKLKAQLDAHRDNLLDGDTDSISITEQWNYELRQILNGAYGASKEDKQAALENALVSLEVEVDRYMSPHNTGVDPETGNRYDLDEDILDQYRVAMDALTSKKEAWSLTKLLDQYIEDKNYLQPSTLKARKNKITSFIQWLGTDKLARKVSKQDAVAYITEVIAKLSLASKTKREHIGHLSAFFSWCEERHYCDDNPFQGKSRLIKDSTRGSTKKTRRPYSEDELLCLFKALQKQKTNQSLWAFAVVGLFTGMRRTEIGEILKKDVHEDYIYVRSGKTPNSIRNVPLHPLIKPLVHSLKETSTDEYLFEGLTRGGDDNKRGHYIGKRFSSIKNKVIQIDNDHRLDFHSFRHNMKTALRNTGLSISLIDEIVGHDYNDKRPSDVYIHQADISILVKAIKPVTHGKKLELYLNESIKKLLDTGDNKNS